MPSFADSEAVLMRDRVLPQHQAALTVVKNRVEAPLLETFRWLDLACGRGQILACASYVFGPSRKKIEYIGVDVNQAFALQAQQLAEPLFRRAEVLIGDVHNFDSLLPRDLVFDFISFTNGAHEIFPHALAMTIVSALCRMRGAGQLYMYDMESLSDPELGAIVWTGPEMETVLRRILMAAGEAKYLPEAAVWTHKSCKGWSLHINRDYISCSADELNGCRPKMVSEARMTIIEILQQKLVALDIALDALSRFGAATANEAREAIGLAYQYWAVSRALSGVVTLASSET